jgi:hypothetical protein
MVMMVMDLVIVVMIMMVAGGNDGDPYMIVFGDGGKPNGFNALKYGRNDFDKCRNDGRFAHGGGGDLKIYYLILRIS